MYSHIFLFASTCSNTCMYTVISVVIITTWLCVYPILCSPFPILQITWCFVKPCYLQPYPNTVIKVFELSNSVLLPSHVQQHVRNDLHVWIVTDGQWSHLLLPYWNKVFQDILHHQIGVFINLQHPVKVAFNRFCSSTCMQTCTFVCIMVWIHWNS